jgi:short-subunit dehydrogenase
VLPADLGDSASPSRLVHEIEQKGLSVDVLVNNAGFGTMGFFHEAPLAKELEMVRVNVSALTELTHRLLPAMISRGRGRVLNVASIAAFQPGPLMAVYYASKAYVLSFSEAVANELGGTGVTVTALCPGPTLTGFQSTAGIERSRLPGRMSVASAASVAEAGYRGMVRGRRIVVPGRLNWILAQGNRLVPRRVATAVARYMQERK